MSKHHVHLAPFTRDDLRSRLPISMIGLHKGRFLDALFTHECKTQYEQLNCAWTIATREFPQIASFCQISSLFFWCRQVRHITLYHRSEPRSKNHSAIGLWAILKRQSYSITCLKGSIRTNLCYAPICVRSWWSCLQKQWEMDSQHRFCIVIGQASFRRLLLQWKQQD